ncbi:FAD/NAD(P)-binding domain superfamily [Fusarium oxysporum f. sp. vasinfectum]|nr:FAD/NAD(P)-binding domain superfamily [Fusarium oxysporum f. sp. vasinfectum]KAK2938532.1 FAD/NADP-binding domain superfamily [Fusarium oxysporum f. sp. vasinfectum]
MDDYCTYDRGPQIGGAWYANTCKCFPFCMVLATQAVPSTDIPGFCYTLALAPKTIFSRLYPLQEETLANLNSVARHSGVHMHFTGSME